MMLGGRFKSNGEKRFWGYIRIAKPDKYRHLNSQNLPHCFPPSALINDSVAVPAIWASSSLVK